MSNDPIVKKLLETKSKIIFEAGEDEEDLDSAGTEEDDSTAPNISPEEAEDADFEEEEASQDAADYDDPPEDSDMSAPSISSGGSSAPNSPSGEGEDIEEPVEREPVEDENPNPLDNTYAVQFSIGDHVTLSYSDGTKDKGLKGTVEGYDKEGFYRVKWSDGSITNGFTDIALSGLTTRVKEDICICGGKKFVTEGKSLICDECGRKIREYVLGSTTAREKEKIRGEHHPVSTARKESSMEEAILSALKRK